MQVVAADPTAAEGGESTGLFRVQRVGPVGDALAVYFTLGGSATGDADAASDGARGGRDWEYGRQVDEAAD